MQNEKDFYAKLLEVQKKIVPVTKDKSNPFFKSKYADINAILDMVKPILNGEGLILLQGHETNQFGDFIKTEITDGKGSIKSYTRIVCSRQNDPQALGSAITYSRRYGLQSLLSIEAEDDDGEKAMFRQPIQQKSFVPTKFVK